MHLVPQTFRLTYGSQLPPFFTPVWDWQDMIVPFGFSVGDFIAGIELIRDLTTALGTASGISGSDPWTLCARASNHWAKQATDGQNASGPELEDRAALLQVIGQCYNAIDTFFSRNKKFQTSLGGNGKRKEQWHDRFLDALRILEWHRYKKEEVVQF